MVRHDLKLRALKLFPSGRVAARTVTARAVAAGALLAGLAACVPYPPPGGTASPGGPATVSQPARPVAILLPLTGPQAELGQNMLRAAQLAFNGQPDAPLDVRDTAGTPAGAAGAARAALANGDGVILGPLTSSETAAVSPLARAANVPVLAFTSDPAQAQPGVWVLGITPDQQVRRLLDAVAAENKTRIAAVLPDNPLGAALGSGLRQAARDAALPPPVVQNYGSGGLSDALKVASGFEARHPAAASDSAASSADPSAPPPAPPSVPVPFDALLLGAVGDQLGQAVPLLATFDIRPTAVRVVGPALWAQNAARYPDLAGAWYAAPDPALRASFLALYTGKYNAPPRDLADLAFDAANIARTAGPNAAGLFRPEGFAGADGPVALLPDGRTRRGLAIFVVERGGTRLLQPAPRSLQPGS